MKRRPSHHRRGYTLIEVLAAFVLIGIVLPVAMQGVTLSLAAAGRAKHTAEATELARHKLTEIALTPADSGPAGDFGTEWPAYKWVARLTPRDYGTTEVAVDVTWTARGKAESVTLTTLVYDPTTTTPTEVSP